uniref:Uncharacterized protein n=1 Tax=Odontella aurita TaxID=265563 RepID=A0A7S4JS04_9STRA
MFVTDSPREREEVVRIRDGTAAATTTTTSDAYAGAGVIRREVYATSTRGKHTRNAKKNPSDEDFAEAALDWYLLGETDLIVGGGTRFTFDKTAALRTSRPYYDGLRGCLRKTLVS